VLPAVPPPASETIAAVRVDDAQEDSPGVDGWVGVADMLGLADVVSVGVATGAVDVETVGEVVLDAVVLPTQPESPAVARQAAAMIVILVTVRMAQAWHERETSVDPSEE